MNYGGDAADQIIRYSMDGLDHGLRLSGVMAKNLAIFIAAVLKDQKKSYGKTRMVRMLKENRPLKFFAVPTERMKEFYREGKKRGLLYVVIKDKKNPGQCEVMVYADDAAKVNRVMDKLNLDFVKSESGEAVHEVTSEVSKDAAVVTEQNISMKTETVQMPEGEIQFEISDLDEDFGFSEKDIKAGNFLQAQEAVEENLSEPSSRSNDIFMGQGEGDKKLSVREELKEIKKEQETKRQKQPAEKNRQNRRKKQKSKRKAKGR